MEIPTSFMGYKKDAVNEIIKEKDSKLETQQKDIDYLRRQVSTLERQSEKLKGQKLKEKSR